MDEFLERYTGAFLAIFDCDPSEVVELAYQGIKAWDSVGHMALIAEIEEAFSIEFEMDDIIAFSSFRAGLEILKKYGV